MKLCKCGCNKQVNSWRQYIQGHNTRKEIIKRFCDKLQDQPYTNCIVFTGTVNSYGYGQFRTRWNPEYTIGAHIFAYILYYKIEPKGHVHHTCKNRRCCNPLHLEDMDEHIHMSLPRAIRRYRP